MDDGDFVVLWQKTLGVQQRVSEQAGKQRGEDVAADADPDIEEHKPLPGLNVGETLVAARYRAAIGHRLGLSGDRPGHSAHVEGHAGAFVTQPIRIKKRPESPESGEGDRR